MVRVLLLALVLFLPAPAEAARPSQCPKRWCGCWLGIYVGEPNRMLWRARNWEQIGHRAQGPAPGVIVVWRNHVGIVVGKSDRGWIVKSGNDSGKVRARVWPMHNVIAYRQLKPRGQEEREHERAAILGFGSGA